LRKRDPRVKKFKEEEEERKKAKQEQIKKFQKQKREEFQEKVQGYEEPEWAKVDYEEHFEHLGNDGDEQNEDETAFFCMACNKDFKSESQKLNHEKSKKHQKALRALRRQLMKEDASFAAEMEDLAIDDDNKVAEAPSDHEPEQYFSADEVLDNRKEATIAEASDVEEELMQDEAGIVNDVNPEDKVETPPLPTKERPPVSKPPKNRRRKKEKPENSQPEHSCNVCSSSFDTRNQLFLHIKSTGHALAPTAGSSNSKSKKKKK
jgi:DnaJ family protein A protein 5